MSGSIFTKLEIDAMQATELLDVSSLTFKYNLPAIVVHPTLVAMAMIHRGTMGGRYKIITAVDWSKGDNYAMLKMRGLSTDALEADGFEFYASNKDLADMRKEFTVLTEFIRTRVSSVAEIRFIFGTNSRDLATVKVLSEALIGIPTPTCVRNDIALKLQINKANNDTHNAFIETVKSHTSVPVKVGGNLNNLRAIVACPSATKYAVTLQQAKVIIKEFQQQPDELATILK